MLVRGNHAVVKGDDAFGPVGQRRIVRHEHERTAVLAMQREQQINHALSRGAIQIAGGLVGQQNARPAGKRARHRHTLLLAARELRGIMAMAMSEPHRIQEFPGAGLCRRRTVQFQRKRDIFQGSQGWDEMKRLKNIPDILTSEVCQLGLCPCRDLMAVQLNGPGGRDIQPGQQSQQGGFPAS